MSMSFTWSLDALESVDQKCLKKKKKILATPVWPPVVLCDSVVVTLILFRAECLWEGLTSDTPTVWPVQPETISKNLTLYQFNRQCQQQLICHSSRRLICPCGYTSMKAGSVVLLSVSLCLNRWKWVSGWTGIFSSYKCPKYSECALPLSLPDSQWVRRAPFGFTLSPSRKRTWHLNAISRSQRCCVLSNLLKHFKQLSSSN